MSEPNASVVLNHLIESCRDGEKGFMAAAELVVDQEARTMFTDNAAQRARFAKALLPHAQRLGGGTAASGTAGASMHRQWMDLRSTLGGQDRGILAEVQRGDNLTVLAFKTAVDSILPMTVRDLVEKQYADLCMARARINSLDQQLAEASSAD
jgi:uncharacterized protein (TIGR02284 family)